ncbi:LysM peptidoglycan-binding domain-containing protein [Bacillus pinisoli]|uniref:LysM peptidoglycan-binding domain-containing protein n=1 Tax=Bacillus pinisoli TaxID=2901866 RepID=UPI001FF45D61|nr:LysM peptidoglycan-binding domain-containing protein [Bacillus pinisoli]
MKNIGKLFWSTTAVVMLGGSLVVNPLESNAFQKVGNSTVVVEKGDTLYKIAKGNDMTVNDLKKLNNLKTSKIYVGQKLVTSKSLETYKVKKGDTLYSIAKKYKTSTSTLKKLNKLESDKIKIGQKLVVKGKVTEQVTQLPKTKKIEIVVEGEKEYREATLFKSSLGYYMYVLKGFTAAAEEPNKDIVFFNNDDSFFFRVEKLDNKTSLEQLKIDSEKLIEHVGKVNEMSLKDATKQMPDGSKLYLHSSNTKLSINVIIIENKGQKYRIVMTLPNKEAAEGVGPSFYGMLKTLTK